MKTTNNNTKLIELNEEQLEYLSRIIIWDKRNTHMGIEQIEMTQDLLEKIKN